MKHNIKIVLCAAALWGCSDATNPTDLPVPAAAQADVFGMAPEGVEAKGIGSMTEEEREAYGNAMVQMRIDLEHAMATPGGWKAIDQKLRPLLDDYPEIEEYQVHQTAGSIMLNTYLLSGEMTDDKAEALAFYTDLLLESGSPNAPLIERALTELRGHWTGSELSAAADAAINSAERYVAAKTDCTGCSGAELLGRVRSTASGDSRVVQVSASIERLDGLR